MWIDHFRHRNEALVDLLGVDLMLLASTLLMPGTVLWTLDKRLSAQAERFGMLHRPASH